MNDDEAARPGWVRVHLARPRRKVRAVRTFISSEEANAPIYLKLRGGGEAIGAAPQLAQIDHR